MDEDLEMDFNIDDFFGNVTDYLDSSEQELFGMELDNSSPDPLHNLLGEDPPEWAASADIPFHPDDENPNEFDYAMRFASELDAREYPSSSTSGSEEQSTSSMFAQDGPSTSAASSKMTTSDSPVGTSTPSSTAMSGPSSSRGSSDSGEWPRAKEGRPLQRRASMSDADRHSLLYHLVTREDSPERQRSPEVIDLTDVSDALPVQQQQRPMQQPRPPMQQVQQPAAAPQMPQPMMQARRQAISFDQAIMPPPAYPLSSDPRVNMKLNNYMNFGQRPPAMPTMITRVEVPRRKKKERKERRTRDDKNYYIGRSNSVDEESHSFSRRHPANGHDQRDLELLRMQQLQPQQPPRPSLMHHLAQQQAQQQALLNPGQHSIRPHHPHGAPPSMPRDHGHHQAQSSMRPNQASHGLPTGFQSQPLHGYQQQQVFPAAHPQQSAHPNPYHAQPRTMPQYPQRQQQHQMQYPMGGQPGPSQPYGYQLQQQQGPSIHTQQQVYPPYTQSMPQQLQYSPDWATEAQAGPSHAMGQQAYQQFPSQSQYQWNPYSMDQQNGQTQPYVPSCAQQMGQQPMASSMPTAGSGQPQEGFVHEGQKFGDMSGHEIGQVVRSTDTTPASSPQPVNQEPRLRNGFEERMMMDVWGEGPHQRLPNYDERGHYMRPAPLTRRGDMEAGMSNPRKRPRSTDDEQVRHGMVPREEFMAQSSSTWVPPSGEGRQYQANRVSSSARRETTGDQTATEDENSDLEALE